MGGSAHMSNTMGVVTISGGVYGYIMAGSRASLLGGGALGAAFLGSSYLVSQGQDLEGHAAAAATSVGLLGIMGPRFLRTKALLPSGLLSVLGVISLAYEGKKTMDWMD